MAAVLAVIFMIGLNTQSAKAEDFEKARVIGVNEAVIDSINSDWDVNYYKFVTTQAGYVQINFTNPLQGDTRTYWKAAFYDSAYKEIWEGDIKGNKENTVFLKTGIPAGTYYIKVSNLYLSTDTYTLSADFTASETWEKELNGEFVNATPMELNTDYHGTTRSRDKDYYKINLQSAGELSITFANPLQGDTRTYWRVYLYNDSYDEMWCKDVTGNNELTKFVSTGLDAGTYYILVDNDYYYSTDEYTLRAGFTVSDRWEKEFNGNFAIATPITLEKAYSGAVSHGWDEDIYRVDIKSDGYYRINIATPNLGDSRCYWRLKLYNAAYEELVSMDVYGSKKNHYFNRTLPAGIYYIKVNTDYYYSSATYNIKVSKWQVQPSQVKASRTEINSLTSDRKKASLQFNPIDLPGIKYQISYKTGEGKWKSKNTAKTSAVIRNLKSERNYSFRVRAYKKINGKMYYGKWSDIRYVWVD